MVKEIIVYLARALNPVAYARDRDKQIQMLKQINKYLRISLNPVAFERDRAAQIEARDKQIRAKDWQLQKKDKQVQALQAKVEALLGASASDIEPLDFNTMGSVDRVFASEETKVKYFSDLQMSVYKLFLRVLLNNVRIEPETRVLDAGCGLGIFTNLVREKLGIRNMYGFDFSGVAIAQARAKYSGIGFFVHDIYEPLDDQYDVITCTETVEHLTDPEAAIQNLLESLSERGVLVLTVPDGRIDHYKNHINFWSPESWKIFVSRLGQGSFTVTVGVVQHPTVATLRYNWATVRREGDCDVFQI